MATIFCVGIQIIADFLGVQRFFSKLVLAAEILVINVESLVNKKKKKCINFTPNVLELNFKS